MTTLTLKRIHEHDDALFGILCVDGKPEFNSLELPWRDNRKSISCIPAGVYKCEYAKSHNFGRVLHVRGVKDRSQILIHPGNTAADTRGCILIGDGFGTIAGKAGILKSKLAVERLALLLKHAIDIELVVA